MAVGVIMLQLVSTSDPALVMIGGCGEDGALKDCRICDTTAGQWEKIQKWSLSENSYVQ